MHRLRWDPAPPRPAGLSAPCSRASSGASHPGAGLSSWYLTTSPRRSNDCERRTRGPGRHRVDRFAPPSPGHPGGHRHPKPPPPSTPPATGRPTEPRPPGPGSRPQCRVPRRDGPAPGPPGPGAPVPARDHPGLGGRGHHRRPRGCDDLPPVPGDRRGPGPGRGPAGRPGPEADLCPLHPGRRLLEAAGRSRRGRPGRRAPPGPTGTSTWSRASAGPGSGP